jgi:hypothetical protein
MATKVKTKHKKKSKPAQSRARAMSGPDTDTELIHIGDLAIDTGTPILADPCRIDEVTESLNGNFDTVCCREQKTGMGIGVSLPTGIGDGIYPVVAEIQKTGPFAGRISHVFVNFTNPFRGFGCHVAFPHAYTQQCEKQTSRLAQPLPESPTPPSADGDERPVLDRQDTDRGFGEPSERAEPAE